SCNEIGVLGVLPGIMGTMQANEVIKIILDKTGVLSGELYCYNALTSDTYQFRIRRNSDIINTIITEGFSEGNPDYQTESCDKHMPEISYEEALKIPGATFIDIREPYEMPKLQHKNVVSIPLGQIEIQAASLRSSEPKVLFCQHGIRSLTAVSVLAMHGIQNCYSLKGGIVAVINDKSYTP
ncbi:MAG: dinucleotide-utilizing protein, partial [Bacteroidia bacterium]|nr:dinucleotide-utilizing protein [Bacteroidia bacterium]